jgi:hypothetical protein
MTPGSKMRYRKYIYWLTEDEETRLREELRNQDIRMRPARSVACTPLNESTRIACVPPGVWDETCARQGSWYRSSDKNGLFLIISSFKVAGLEARLGATITRTAFRPPKLAVETEKQAMANDSDFQKHIPERWRNVKEVEKKITLKWAKMCGSETEDFDFLYLSHTANHANFIKPIFYVEKKGLRIPYSIDRSAHLCSCCLELFQILEDEHPKKYVAPCPGATIFANLKPDQYLLVEKA